MYLQNQVRNPNLTTSLSNSNTCSIIEPFDEYSEYWRKFVTYHLIDKPLLVKIGRVSNPFLLDVSSKLEQTFSDGVLQQLSALHFIPDIVVLSKLVFCAKISFSNSFFFQWLRNQNIGSVSCRKLYFRWIMNRLYVCLRHQKPYF